MWQEYYDAPFVDKNSNWKPLLFRIRSSIADHILQCCSVLVAHTETGRTQKRKTFPYCSPRMTTSHCRSHAVDHLFLEIVQLIEHLNADVIL